MATRPHPLAPRDAYLAPTLSASRRDATTPARQLFCANYEKGENSPRIRADTAVCRDETPRHPASDLGLRAAAFEVYDFSARFVFPMWMDDVRKVGEPKESRAIFSLLYFNRNCTVR